MTHSSLTRSGMVLLGLLLSATLTPAPVMAFCTCSGAISAHAGRTNTNRNQNTEALIDAFTRQIAASTGQITGYIDKSVAAQEKIADSLALNDSTRQKQIARGEAEAGRYDPAASACAAMGAALVATSTSGPGSAVSGVNSGAGTVQQIRAYETCDPDGETPGEVCQGNAAIVTGMLADRAALAGAAGLDNPTGDAQLLLLQPTIGAGTATTPEDINRAVWRLSQNMLNPFPEPPASRIRPQTPAARLSVADQQARSTRRSSLEAMLAWIHSRSAPLLPAGDWARRVAPEGYGYPIDDLISLRQYYDVAVATSYRNPEWHDRVNAMSPEAAARELVFQTALANDLAWMSLELQLHQAATSLAVGAHQLEQ